MACEFEERIDRRVLGDLGPEELAELRTHLPGCAPCAARFDEASYMETLLVGAFREAAGGLGSPRAAVLAQIAGRRPGSGRHEARRAPAPRVLGRRFGTFLLLNGVAAALVLAAALGYAYRGLVVAKRQALTLQAKVEVKNLAIVLRARGERRREAARPSLAEAAAELPGALAALGLEHDAFGNPFRVRGAAGAVCVYSCGPNGRDDAGAGDDIVAVLGG
jgi:hypothetical protein